MVPIAKSKCKKRKADWTANAMKGPKQRTSFEHHSLCEVMRKEKELVRMKKKMRSCDWQRMQSCLQMKI